MRAKRTAPQAPASNSNIPAWCNSSLPKLFREDQPLACFSILSALELESPMFSLGQFVNRRILTLRMSPNPARVAIIDDPPELIRGSVRPFTGTRPADMVML
jgi:hypothetical protein